MAAVIFDGLDALRAAVGAHLGPSDWVSVDSERFALFGEATGDADPAHPMLLLSMSNELLPQLMEVRGVSMGVNYGVDRVRFPAPVDDGDRVRAHADIVEVTEVNGGVQAAVTITLERDRAGEAETVCVIDSLSRFFA